MTRAAVYARISDDREGAGLGVARQLEDARKLVAARGWELAGTFVDNDVSAYSGRAREAYQALLAAVDGGEVDVIVAWHPDRIHRSPRELEDFISLLERTGATVATVTAGELDLGSPSGRMVARMLGAAARHESEHKAARIRRKHEELARAGKVGNGGARPFGFERDRLTVRDDEAELLREAAERIAAGGSLRGVLADWERRGIRTVTGKRWYATPLRRMLVAPRTAGLRQLRGEIVGPAVWPAILDRATWERVRAILLAPDRRRAGPPRRYLLTGGVAVCGVCDAPLVARPQHDGRRLYVCAAGVGRRGCGMISALAEPLEAEVRDQALVALDGPALRRARAGSDDDGPDLLGELRAAEDALAELEVAHFTDRILSRAGYLKARERLDGRVNAARRALARRDRVGVLADLPASSGALRAAWDAGDVEWRRRLLAAVVEQVTVGPAVRGRNVFDPSRVKVVWRA